MDSLNCSRRGFMKWLGLAAAGCTLSGCAEAMQSPGYATGHVGKWHMVYTPETMPHYPLQGQEKYRKMDAHHGEWAKQVEEQ